MRGPVTIRLPTGLRADLGSAPRVPDVRRKGLWSSGSKGTVGRETNYLKSPRDWISKWLASPQVTVRQALGVGVVGSLISWLLLWVAGKLLEVVNVVDFDDTVPVWLAAAAAGVGLAAGLIATARARAVAGDLESQVDRLGDQADELRAHRQVYDTYAEHLRDALGDLRKVIAGELQALSLRDFIETGLFEPAQRLLLRSGERGEIRFSVLHADGDDFVMSGEKGLFPALGHTPEGRQKFRLPIDSSFSMYAYRNRQVTVAEKLSEDERFREHPQAKRPYESIVSVPLWHGGDVDGVFNVVATSEGAFTPIDRTYLALIGSVIDVARAAGALWADTPDTGDDPVSPTET